MELLVSILIPVGFVVALLIEKRFPARPLTKVKRWLAKGLLFFIFTGLVNALVPVGVAMLVGEHAPLNLRPLGTLGGAVVGFLFADFVGYWIHRFMHRVHFVSAPSCHF